MPHFESAGSLGLISSMCPRSAARESFTELEPQLLAQLAEVKAGLDTARGESAATASPHGAASRK